MTEEVFAVEKREPVNFGLIRKDGSLDMQKLADSGPQEFVEAIVKDFQIHKLHPDSPFMHALFTAYGMNLWMLTIGSLGQAKRISDIADRDKVTNAEAFAKMVSESESTKRYVDTQRCMVDLLRRIAFDMTVAERMNSKHPEAEDRLATHLHKISGVPPIENQV